MLKKLMVTTALSGLMIGAALAQSSPPRTNSDSKMMTPSTSMSAPAPSGSTHFINSQQPDQWLASKFKGTDVVGTDDKKIGDVTDMLFDQNGKIEAYVVSVGGFLGMGAKDVALAPSSFQVVRGDKSKNESDKLRLSMTKDELKQAANFEPYKAPSTTTGSATPSTTRPAPMSPPPASK